MARLGGCCLFLVFLSFTLICLPYSLASLSSQSSTTTITSHFPIYPFYLTTLFPILLSSPALPPVLSRYSHRCSPLSSSLYYPLLLSSVNCSLNPVRVRLQLTLPQLHMSILPPLLLLLLPYSAWVGTASPPGIQGGGELGEPGPGMGPACLPAWDTAVKNRAVSPSLSFFLCTSGAWGDWAMLCCVVLSLAQHGCRILAWLRWSRFGFEMWIGPLLYPHG